MVKYVGLTLLVGLVAASSAWAGDEAAQGGQNGSATFQWSGVYFGGNVAFGWNNFDSTTTNTVNNISTPTTTTNQGALGGGQVGYNVLSSSHWLFGVETDVDGTTLSKTTNAVNTAGVTTATSATNTKALGTVRGELGRAWNAMLLSVDGGLAWHDVRATRTQVVGKVNNATAGTVEDNSGTTGGWTLGASAAAGFHRHVVVKAEYLFLHFAHTNTTPFSLLSTTTAGHLQIIRLGVNYLFN